MKLTGGRPAGSKNTEQVVHNPYKLLALKVLGKALDDKDINWLRGSDTVKLSLWCDQAGIEIEQVNKITDEMLRRLKLKYESVTKTERNRAIIKYHADHPNESYADIGIEFGLTKQRVHQILMNGLRWVDKT